MQRAQIVPPIPVIDLFAGPGGLGEGFASLEDGDGNHVFRIALSVEADKAAHRTLELRAFYRQFSDEERPDDYYAYVTQPKPTPASREALFKSHPLAAANARKEAWRHTLSKSEGQKTTDKARAALDGATEWVLVGGPPCQAYSLVGRSRRARDEAFGDDEKHTLYLRYLQIIKDLKPPVFVMENVKGMLSATLGRENTFEKVREDLKSAGLGYRVVPCVARASESSPLAPRDFVIRTEEHGVPQTRHRVILLGLRSDTDLSIGELRPSDGRVSAGSVLRDLPRLRSRLSGRRAGQPDSEDAWLDVMVRTAEFLSEWKPAVGAVARRAATAAGGAGRQMSRPPDAPPQDLWDWYTRDSRAEVGLNHETRSHQPTDVERYLFCASFARRIGRSPKLSEFPRRLLPEHKNVHDDKFVDRFRVQLAGQPATTITSHISKDGHYYIHYDPSQCRSLSVREAARLQTFPDDYFFEGNRTQQYHQVGNAVPPFLARQLARVVAQALGRNRGERGRGG